MLAQVLQQNRELERQQQMGQTEQGLLGQLLGSEGFQQASPLQQLLIARQAGLASNIDPSNLLSTIKAGQEQEQVKSKLDLERANVAAKLKEPTKRDEKFAESVDEKARLADDTLRSINTIEEQLAEGATGPVTGFLFSLGEHVPVLKGLTQTPGSAAFNSAVKQLVGEYKKIFQGRITDADLRFIESALPDLSRSPEANQATVEVLRRGAMMAQREQQILDDLVEENNGRLPLNANKRVRERLDPEIRAIEDSIASLKADFEERKLQDTGLSKQTQNLVSQAGSLPNLQEQLRAQLEARAKQDQQERSEQDENFRKFVRG